MSGPTFIARWRFAFVFVAIALGYCGVVGRLYYLQVAKGPELSWKAEQGRQRIDVLNARRGNIADRNGNLLAATRPVRELGVDPEGMREQDWTRLPALAALLGMPLNDLKAACQPGTFKGKTPGEVRKVRWRKLADAIDEPLYEKIRALNIPAVYGNRKFVRDYPSGSEAAHLIGFLNKEGTAVMGVESQMDYYLRGQDGWRETEADSRRHEMAQFRKREIPARDGLNVELTIDLVVQDMIEREAAKLAETYHPDSVVILVSDPNTGDILGLCNWPTFDPNDYGNFPIEYERNRAVTDVYEPGSTFKIVPVAGALDSGLVRPDSRFDCDQKVVTYEGREIRMPGEAHPSMGVLPVSGIVTKSSNRGSALLGMRLGDKRFLDYVYKFGFGSRTGSFGPGEVAGIVHPLDKWDGLTISRMPMGQAVCVTAVQMHYAMSAVANGGVLMKPRLVERIYDNNGDTVFSFDTKSRNRVMSERTSDELKKMLETVTMQGGTAPRAGIKGYEVAGKTGTSQKIENGHYSHTKHVATFTGFFPASNPQIAVTVVVDNGKKPGGGICYGGVVAAPAFKEIAQQIIQYKAMEPPSAGNNRLYAASGEAR